MSFRFPGQVRDDSSRTLHIPPDHPILPIDLADSSPFTVVSENFRSP